MSFWDKLLSNEVLISALVMDCGAAFENNF